MDDDAPLLRCPACDAEIAEGAECCPRCGEEPAEEEADEPQGSALVRCRNCGKEIYEEAERCPACGEYRVVGGAGVPAWIRWGAVALVAIFVLWAVSMCR